jgi:hypothetical protein
MSINLVEALLFSAIGQQFAVLRTLFMFVEPA